MKSIRLLPAWAALGVATMTWLGSPLHGAKRHWTGGASGLRSNPDMKHSVFSRSRCRRTLPSAFLFGLLLAGTWQSATLPLYAIDRSWPGLASANWSNPNNWTPTGVPQNGDSLWFYNDNLITSSVNDLVDLAVASVSFAESDHTISGNPLTMTSPTLSLYHAHNFVTGNPSYSTTINCPLIFPNGGEISTSGAPGTVFEKTDHLYLRGQIPINSGRLTFRSYTDGAGPGGDGGIVRCPTAGIGSSAFSVSNVGLVSGPHSLWNITLDFSAGGQGQGSQLLVTDGGTVGVGRTLVVGETPGAVGERLELNDGSVLVTNAFASATMDVRRGTNVLNAGLLDVDRFILANVGGLFEFNGGTFSTKQTRVSNGTLFRVGNGVSPATFLLTTTNVAVPGLPEFDAVLAVMISSNATLAGNGAIAGPAPVPFRNGSRLAPGLPQNPFGQILFSNAPTLGGTVAMDIGRDGTSLRSDQVQVSGSLTYGGALVVSDLGPTALDAGDRFALFSADSFNGAFSTIILPPLRAGLNWTNTLSVDGSIEVIGPGFSGFSLVGTNVVFSGAGGAADAAFTVLTATNVAEALTNWLSIATNRFALNGEFQFTNPVNAGELQRFFRLQTS